MTHGAIRLPDGSFSGFLVTEIKMTPEVAEKERLLKIFREMDEDNNRTLEVDELEHLAENHELGLTAAELHASMAELDPENSGHVDFQTFFRWYFTKHAEEGEHSAILKVVEEEMSRHEEAEVPKVYFYEVLYGLVERKSGQAMPASNQLCKEVRRRLGRRMPQVAAQIEEDDEREAEAALFSQTVLYDTFGAMARVRENWESPVIHEGVLRKLRTEDNAWITVRFQLTEAELRWGTGSTDKAFTIDRALGLDILVDVRLPTKHATTVSFSFEVKARPKAQTLGTKIYRLAADSEASRDAWVAAIQNATVADMSASDDARLQVRVISACHISVQRNHFILGFLSCSVPAFLT